MLNRSIYQLLVALYLSKILGFFQAYATPTVREMTSEISSGPLSKCNYCRYIFPSRILEIKNSTKVSLTNIKEPCPRCGETAQVLDGTYNFDVQGVAELVSGSAFTKEIYDQFAKLIERVKEENIEKDEFIKKVEEISPDLAFSIKKYIPNDPSSFLTFITLLWSVFTYYNPRSSEEAMHITNYDQTTINVYRYDREIKVPKIYPKQQVKSSNGENIKHHTEIKTYIKKEKPKQKKHLKAETVKIDTSNCDSTKATIKRLLKRK